MDPPPPRRRSPRNLSNNSLSTPGKSTTNSNNSNSSDSDAGRSETKLKIKIKRYHGVASGHGEYQASIMIKMMTKMKFALFANLHLRDVHLVSNIRGMNHPLSLENGE